MYSNRIIGFTVMFITWSCSPAKEKTDYQIDLPYYNEPDFTPKWIEENDPRHANIHTISSFLFLNQNGDTITNETFDDKVYAANFFFSICPNVCPKMAKNLLKVQKEFSDDNRVKILSHTVMPWVDSVAGLHEYAELNGIRSDQWHLVTGSKKDLYSIARKSYFADEGFGKTITDESDFLHTENIVLIDQKRRIRGVYNGTIPLEMKRMIEDIRTLLEE